MQKFGFYLPRIKKKTYNEQNIDFNISTGKITAVLALMTKLCILMKMLVEITAFSALMTTNSIVIIILVEIIAYLTSVTCHSIFIKNPR